MDTERFWSKVDKTGECWIWTGARSQGGYGQSSRGLAHRVAYRLVKGPIPEGLMLLHGCDNRACCNPDHLTPGTHAENMADMVRKGRSNAWPREWKPPRRFFIPAERASELDAALRKMKLSRPFDSMSQIIVDAIVAAAARIESDKTKTPEDL